MSILGAFITHLKGNIMFNDLIDLIKIQSKNIEHYKQYPIAFLFFIMFLLEFLSTFFSEGYGSTSTSNFTISLIIVFVFTFIEAVFFVYWFGRIGKNHSFLTFLHYDVMLSIAANIPVIIVLLITQNFNSSPWVAVIGFLAVFIYVIYMFSANLALATTSSKKYAFGAILIVALLQFTVQLLVL
jgi:hypothetical protein